MKIKKFLSFSMAALAATGFAACDDDDNDGANEISNGNTYEDIYDGSDDSDEPGASGGSFAKGADVSWVTEMESNGIKFKDAAGNEGDCFQILKDMGTNAIRLRVWVNPEYGYCAKEDVVDKAVRANDLGMDVMIDFHYSDTWADPSNQSKPAAWASLSYSELKDAVANHTTDILSTLKDKGVTPKWVQIGNEVGDGFLWGDGKASTNAAQFGELVTVGIDAAKAVFPDIKTIIHVQNGWNTSTTDWIMSILKSNGVAYDIFGVSLYPSDVVEEYGTKYGTATDVVKLTLDNLKTLSVRYNKDVMVCEYGYLQSDPDKGYECLKMIVDAKEDMPALKGVFYWEPEGYGWNHGYGKSCFDSDFKPTKVLTAYGE